MKTIQLLANKVAGKAAPPPELTVSEWADEYRRLSSEVSPEPGKWSTDRAPYQREIMDCFSDPLVERITVKTSAQVGKTSIVENVMGYFASYDPCPILVVEPRLEDAEDFSKDRLAPLIRDTEALAEIFGAQKAKDSSNTLLHKKFPGGYFKLGGANSPAGLAAKSIRILLLDEVDRYPTSAGEEGDPVSLAVKRTNNFHNRKIGAFSTPTRKGHSRIEALYEESDKRTRHVKCPHCEAWIKFDFKQLKWEDNDPLTTLYLCQECDAVIDESLKPKLQLEGKWIAEKEFKGHAGFALNELYSPWRKWSQIVADFLEAKKDPIKLKTWVNTSLGETWEEKGEAPEWRRVYEKRESYPTGHVPMRGLFLTGSADIQKDRIEIEIKAWGRNKENWSIDHRALMGETSLDAVWNELSAVIGERFPHESGSMLDIKMFCIDSGFNTQRVYDFVRGFPSNRVVAIKGAGNQQLMIAPPKAADISIKGKTVRRGLKVWPVGTDQIKSEFYSWLRIEKPTEEELKLSEGLFPYGYPHYPEYPPEFFKQLTSEALISKTVKGYKRYEWAKIYERNETLDLHVYNRAAAAIIGIDRFKDHNWDDFEKFIPKSQENSNQKIENKMQPSIVKAMVRKPKKESFWD